MLSVNHTVEASSSVRGSFVDVIYEEIQIDKKTTQKRLKSITLQNDSGKKVTFNIDSSTLLSIDSIPVTIDAFKLGMTVEADINLRRVKELRGKTGNTSGEIVPRSKVVVGTVSNLGGSSLSVTLDDGRKETYYLNASTDYFESKKIVNHSNLRNGDRVKLYFSDYNDVYIESIDIMTQGIQVKNLYKGILHQIDTARNQLHLKDEKTFRYGDWQLNSYLQNPSYSYAPNTPIYVGNELIKKDQLKHYRNHEVYFVTVEQFGKEIIQKIIIRKTKELSLNNSVRTVDNTAKNISFYSTRSMKYHEGTIAIRNGRLIDTTNLIAGDSVYVAAEGSPYNPIANVVYVTNQNFQSSSLDKHSIYFGQINTVNGTQLSLTNSKLLSPHSWQNTIVGPLTFDQNTYSVQDSWYYNYPLNPLNELKTKVGLYGYFYVSEDKITAIHLIQGSIEASLVSVGQFDGISYNGIAVQDTKQWQLNTWTPLLPIQYIDTYQTTVIRDGKVISTGDLRFTDYLYILQDSNTNARIIFAD